MCGDKDTAVAQIALCFSQVITKNKHTRAIRRTSELLSGQDMFSDFGKSPECNLRESSQGRNTVLYVGRQYMSGGGAAYFPVPSALPMSMS
jgi:hypothetical protein